MTRTLTINTALISPNADKPLTPAMVTALWVIADHIDRKGIKVAVDDPLWLELPAKSLRGEGGRDDNIWLRECLDRLTGIKIAGEYRGDPWGAVILAEWRIVQGGSLVRLLVPPAAINVLRAPETFAKVEAFAAYKLDGHARRLYAALADKKRMRQSHWVFGLDELRQLFGVQNRQSYDRFNNFRQRVLAPALAQINDFGTVNVTMTPEKVGRSVAAVRFDWQWKSLDEARETGEENDRPNIARRKSEDVRDMPPLMSRPAPQDDAPARRSPEELEERRAFADKVMRDAGLRKPRT